MTLYISMHRINTEFDHLFVSCLFALLLRLIKSGLYVTARMLQTRSVLLHFKSFIATILWKLFLTTEYQLLGLSVSVKNRDIFCICVCFVVSSISVTATFWDSEQSAQPWQKPQCSTLFLKISDKRSFLAWPQACRKFMFV